MARRDASTTANDDAGSISSANNDGARPTTRSNNDGARSTKSNNDDAGPATTVHSVCQHDAAANDVPNGDAPATDDAPTATDDGSSSDDDDATAAATYDDAGTWSVNDDGSSTTVSRTAATTGSDLPAANDVSSDAKQWVHPALERHGRLIVARVKFEHRFW